MANRKRKTPPVAIQVIAPRLRTSAKHKKLLIDFDTGSDVLEEQHKLWLRQSMEDARRNASFHVYIAGYASKLGKPGANLALSLKRMDSVIAFLQTIERRTLENVTNFRAEGEEKSTGGEGDDAPEWRAVEVHIFIGKPPHHEKPNLPEIPLPMIRPSIKPLPGGDRFKEWAVATPGGAFVSVVGGGGFNIFFIKNRKLGETRGYIQPVAGVGAGISIPAKPIWNVIQAILTGVSAAPPDFTDVETSVPVTWNEIESCLVRVTSGGGGIGADGRSLAVITFISSGVWQYNEFGNHVKVPAPGDGVLFQFQSFGKSWQLGLAAGMVLGPLIRIPG